MGVVEELDVSTSTPPEKEEGKPLPRKIKILTAIAIFYGNITFGCAFNTYGPVLTSLQNKYETDDATISKAFSILTGGNLIGALTAGIVYNYVNRQLAVITILSTMSAMMFLTPHCPSLATFFPTVAIMGLCAGSYDTAQFVWMMEMMQKDCPPYVQGQHFFYAVGTNLATLIMAPFLDEDDDEDETTTKATTLKTMSNNSDLTVIGTNANDESSDYDKLFIPYTIVGFLVALAVAFHIFLFIFFRYFEPPREVIEKEEDSQSIDENKMSVAEPKEEKPLIGSWVWPKVRIVVLSACYYAAYQGMEMCMFQFFSKFAQNSDLALSESQAAYVLTGMTVAFAVGRGISIVAVFKISPQLLILGSLVLVSIANVLLIGWAVSSKTVLWACSIIFGLGFSSMYASFASYIERYLFFTNFIGSLMLLCGAGVAAIYPLVIGSFIEDNPVVLSYTTFFSIALLIFAFSTLSYLTYKNKTRY